MLPLRDAVHGTSQPRKSTVATRQFPGFLNRSPHRLTNLFNSKAANHVAPNFSPRPREGIDAAGSVDTMQERQHLEMRAWHRFCRRMLNHNRVFISDLGISSNNTSKGQSFPPTPFVPRIDLLIVSFRNPSTGKHSYHAFFAPRVRVHVSNIYSFTAL